MRGWVAWALLIAACGTRTALDPGQRATHPPPPPPPPPIDAGMDAGPRDAGRPDSGPPDAGLSPDGGPPCIPERAVLLPGQVDVVFLIDRSSSMGWRIGTSEEIPWDILQTAMDEVLGELDPRVSTGASFFPAGPLCELSVDLDVPVAPDNMPAVLAAFERGVIDGRSPLPNAFERAALAFAIARPEARNRFIVVLSDGGLTGCFDTRRPEHTVRSVRRDFGIETFAVAIGRGGSWLVEAARDGGRGRVYEGADLGSLRAVLRAIESELTGCVFDASLMTTDEAQVTVKVGGVSVPFDRRNGWAWSGLRERSISLFGEACARRIAEDAVLEAEVTCAPDGG